MKFNIPVIASLCFFLLGSQELNAKRNLILMRPEATGGFMVLDKSADASITSWTIAIYKEPTDGTASASVPVPEVTYTLTGKNYQAIPKVYYSPGEHAYFYTITGYNSEGKDVVTQGSEKSCVGCTNQIIRSWTCVGNTYAWKVTLSKDESGMHYLQLSPAIDSILQQNGGIAVPYYEWGTLAFKQSICDSSINRLRYGLSDWDCSNVNAGKNVITGVSVSPYYLTNGKCENLTEDVFGVQKYLNTWYNAAGKIVPIGSSTPSFGIGMSDMLTYVNWDDKFELGSSGPLSCASCGGSPSWPGVADGIDWAQHYEDVRKCLFSDCEEWDDWWNIVSDISYLVGGEPIEINDEITWHSGLVAINIARVDESGMNILLGKDRLFDSEGKLIAPALKFDKGLYKIEFIRENNTRLPFYAEVKTALDYSIKESDLFKATIYPVPITGSSFSIDMQAYAKLGIKYTLYNPGMAVVRTERFKLAKGYKGTKVIDIPSPSAAGNYTHVFTFPDGSAKSFITPKH